MAHIKRNLLSFNSAAFKLHGIVVFFTSRSISSIRTIKSYLISEKSTSKRLQKYPKFPRMILLLKFFCCEGSLSSFIVTYGFFRNSNNISVLPLLSLSCPSMLSTRFHIFRLQWFVLNPHPSHESKFLERLLLRIWQYLKSLKSNNHWITNWEPCSNVDYKKKSIQNVINSCILYW